MPAPRIADHLKIAVQTARGDASLAPTDSPTDSRSPIMTKHSLSRRKMLGLLGALPIVSETLLHPAAAPAQGATPAGLPSWNEGATKQSILDFVAAVTREGSPDFVPPAERIATFDNDGTLWVEHPMYTQMAFALDRVKALAPLHPEWKDTQPFKAALEGDMKTLAASGEHGLMALVVATHTGMTVDEFQKIVLDWIATARDPRFKRPYTDLVYLPMIELLGFLRTNGFKTFIASGGGVEFMRPWTERVYGVPPGQVVGSSIKTRFEMRDGRPLLFRLAEVSFVDDGAGKPVGINEHIGRRPIAAFGNSDGDLEMLQWTTMSGGRRLGLIVHHTDATREYAYDRDTSVGRLDKALEAAAVNQWTVVDMKNDWKRVFAFE
jgi:phosphoglycolate phosphatase-like HAD superfamily hydrolase